MSYREASSQHSPGNATSGSISSPKPTSATEQLQKAIHMARDAMDQARNYLVYIAGYNEKKIASPEPAQHPGNSVTALPICDQLLSFRRLLDETTANLIEQLNHTRNRL